MPPPPTELSRCATCDGFSPPRRAACVHCDAPVRSRLGQLGRALAAGAGAGAFMMTLMACYGRSHQPACTGSNADGDGSCLPDDCNDGDPAVHPGAQDPEQDGIDQNCDGVDGWRDPAAVVEPTPPEPTPVATDPSAPTPIAEPEPTP